MSWILASDRLTFTASSAPAVELPCPEGKFAGGTWFELIPGLAKFRLGSGASLQVKTDGEGRVVLTSAGGGTFDIALSPLIPLMGNRASRQLVCWVVSTLGADAAGLVFSADLSAEFTLVLDAKPLLAHLAEQADKLAWRAFDAVTPIFKRPFLRRGGDRKGGGESEDLTDLKLVNLKPSFEAGALVFHQIGLELRLGSNPANLIRLALDRLEIGLNDLKVRLEGGGFLSAVLNQDVLLFEGADNPVTLQLHGGSTFGFFLALNNPRIEITPAAGRPAMSAILPGCDATALASEERETPRRFILDFTAADAGKLILGANGLTGKAAARMRPLQIGDGGAVLDGAVTGGQISFQDGKYDASLTATVRLPYFKNSEGSLAVRSASGGEFAARWELSPGQIWKDPTGHVEVHDPKASVSVGWKDGQWSVSGSLGGRLELMKTPRFSEDAGRWLGDFAKKLRFEFSDLKLNELGKPGMRVSLQLLDNPRGLDLWGVFKLNLSSFELLSSGFAFGGEMGFNLGGLSFKGSLPRLVCAASLNDGIRISADPADALFISGQLATPGGVKASLTFRQQNNGAVDELVGTGALSIPGMPAVFVLCALGRRPRPASWDPVFLLYAQSDIPIPLFPGVVLRDIGLGFGINKVLAAVNEIPPEQVLSNLMNGPLGLPNAAAPESWATPPSSAGFDLSLVAQTAIAPANQGDGPFPYAGRATLYARPTNEFVIVLGSSLWLMTRLTDSRTPEFSAAPAMKGALVLFPRHGFLEMQVRTERNPRMSAPIPLLEHAFSIASGEFYLKAARDTFLFRAGPLRAETNILGIKLKGEIVYAVYAGAKGAVTVMQASLEGAASCDWRATVRFGPLSVTAGFHLRLALAFETVLAGMYLAQLHSPALYARVRVYVLVELTARLTIEFRLVIKIWRFRKVLSWSKSFGASLRLSVDLRLELVLSNNPALHARARIEIRLFGYSFAPSVTLGNPDHPHLKTARQELSHILTMQPKEPPALSHG